MGAAFRFEANGQNYTSCSARSLSRSHFCPSPALAITNGTPDDGQPAQFPNVGAIVADKVPLPFAGITPPQTISSGTLIHPRVVLTAGHSLEFMDQLVGLPATDGSTLTINDFSVTFDFDAHDPFSATHYPVHRIVYPPNYVPFLSAGRPEASRDFGFIILDEAVDASFLPERSTPLEWRD